jgi:hypothetical protein
MDFVGQIDLENIREKVFKLFDLSTEIPPVLSLYKFQVITGSMNPTFMAYLDCLKEAHD